MRENSARLEWSGDMKVKQKARPAIVAGPIRLDIGCGKNKKPGFVGMDQYPMEGVDVVHDVRKPWPYENESVEEVHCSHFLEHLTGEERVTFFNELYRVMKPGAKAMIITPHWASGRAYGDPTHKWPPVSEFGFFYLLRNWRESNAPHTDAKWNKSGYDCDFECTGGYSMHPSIVPRDQSYQQYALQHYKEAAQDTITTLTRK